MNSTAEIGYVECGHATGKVRHVLRGEALAIFGASTTVFVLLGGELWLFAVLFFVPDLSIAAYAAGSKAGALVYNTVHSYALPAMLSVAGVLSNLEIVWQIGLIFVAHAAFDRSLGYGLKYAAGFRHTHLGPIGKPAPDDH
ncbi:DUF4260 family protein [Mesorhizobium microcysteis]|jgi:hypothetical protein|uniref:DUF4260 family protein n=1 Tax=Neoaquamicrobium microcysteis TaxID=2682781 RepID=A0A5D4H540_9HYPH|nr:DUF4260 domain-containing protein [Mesorhizobium microcysteis]TYR35634.1 DUF4260 family protein [Mesorhizobium microcysteis]